MVDILSSLLQGINDHFGRFVSFFRAFLPYKGIVQDAVDLDLAVAESVVNAIEKTCIPPTTKVFLFQYLNNKEQWEILFLSKECKYLGHIFLSADYGCSLAELNTAQSYKYTIS